MKLKDAPDYECDKCHCHIKGGFNPTGFCFLQGGNDSHLCRPCYEDFWNLMNKIESDFVNQWLKE